MPLNVQKAKISSSENNVKSKTVRLCTRIPGIVRGGFCRTLRNISHSKTLLHLKARIQEKIALIPMEMLRKVL